MATTAMDFLSIRFFGGKGVNFDAGRKSELVPVSGFHLDRFKLRKEDRAFIG